MVGSRSPEDRCTWQRYWANAVDVPGPTTEALSKVARQTKTYLVIGVVERDTDYGVQSGPKFCFNLLDGDTIKKEGWVATDRC